MSEIETQDQRAPQGSTCQTPDMVSDCGDAGTGCSPTVADPMETTTLERGEVASRSSHSSPPSVENQNCACAMQNPRSNSGITVDNAEQVVHSLNLLGFHQKIRANPHPVTLTVSERWVDTARGLRHVIYLSDIC